MNSGPSGVPRFSPHHISSPSREGDASRSKYSESRERKREKTEKLKKELADAQHAESQLTSKNQQLEKELTDAEEALRRSQASRKKWKQTAEAKVKAIRDKVEPQLRRQIQKLQHEVDVLQRKDGAWTGRCERVEDENRRIREQLRSLINGRQGTDESSNGPDDVPPPRYQRVDPLSHAASTN